MAKTKKTKKLLPEFDAYVLHSVAFEYDDQNYYTGENSTGSTVKVYMSREKAEKDWIEKNMAELVDVNLFEYSICEDHDEIKSILEKLGIEYVEEDEYDVKIKSLTPEQAKLFMGETGLEFYSIEKVKLDIDRTKKGEV